MEISRDKQFPGLKGFTILSITRESQTVTLGVGAVPLHTHLLPSWPALFTGLRHRSDVPGQLGLLHRETLSQKTKKKKKKKKETLMAFQCVLYKQAFTFIVNMHTFYLIL